MGCRALAASADRRHELDAVLGRQHFPPGSARPGALGTPVWTSAADPSCLLADGQHHPLLQPAVYLDVRARGVRHLPVGVRPDRRSACGVRGRTGLRIPSLSHRLGAALAGDELAVDAVRALRAEPVCHPDPGSRIPEPGVPGPRSWHQHAGLAELVVRLLPALFRSVRAAIRAASDVVPGYFTQRPHVAWLARRGCWHPGPDAAVPDSVYASTATVRARAALRRGRAVLCECLVICHCLAEPVAVWPVAALLPAR